MTINELLGAFECPLINAFFFPDGSMLVLNSNSSGIDVLCRSDIDSFFRYNNINSISSIDVYKEYENDKYIARIGEGSFGSDGFVWLTNKERELVWFLFLDNCNPFNDVNIKNDLIEATSTMNIKIQIPTNVPENIVVISN